MKQIYEKGDYVKINWQGLKLEGIITNMVIGSQYYFVFCPGYEYPSKNIPVNEAEITRKLRKTEIVFFKVFNKGV